MVGTTQGFSFVFTQVSFDPLKYTRTHTRHTGLMCSTYIVLIKLVEVAPVNCYTILNQLLGVHISYSQLIKAFGNVVIKGHPGLTHTSYSPGSVSLLSLLS